MSEAGDEILWALSGWGKTSYSRFKSLLSDIGRSKSLQDPLDARQLLRQLSASGYIEYSFSMGRGTITITPTVLRRLPVGGRPLFYLAGGRSRGAFEALQRSMERRKDRVSINRAKTDGTPTPISLEFSGAEAACEAARRLGVPIEPTPACWGQSDLVPVLASMSDTLDWVVQPELSWERWDFCPERLAFSQAKLTGTSLRLTRYKDPIRRTFRFKLWRQDAGVDIDPDLGRYILLQEHRKCVIAYDLVTGSVSVPLTCPLPDVAAKAFCYASGNAFARVGNTYVFEKIPPDVFHNVANKLGQR